MFCGLGLWNMSQEWHILSFDIPSCATLVSHEPSCCRLLVFLYLSFMPSCLLSWAAPRQAATAGEIYCLYFVYNLIRSLFMPLTWHLHKKSLIKCSHRTQINTCLNCTVTFRLKLNACTSSGCVHSALWACRHMGLFVGFHALVTQRHRGVSTSGMGHSPSPLILAHSSCSQAGVKALNKELFLFVTSISFTT